MLPALSRMLRNSFAVVAASALVFFSSAALADVRADFDKARASFNARSWSDAEERFRALLDPKAGLKERSLVSQARMYLGASLLEQGNSEGAKEIFEQLVLEDPTFDPDPLSFPGQAINTFIDVRSSLLEQIRNAQQTAARLAAERKAREEAEREKQRVWLETVKAQAAEEKITVRHSRLVASLPFGVGQFQNGQQVLGWGFAGTEVAALAGTVVTYGMYRYARSRENEELRQPGGDVYQLAPQYHQRAEELRVANLAFVGGFLTVTAIGILQAHVAFIPESAEKKKRELPPLAHATMGPLIVPRVLAIAPLVTPVSGPNGELSGVVAGLRGLVF